MTDDAARDFFPMLGARVAAGGPEPSARARREARLCLADTIACMLAGRHDPAPVRVAAAMAACGSVGPVPTPVPGTALSGSAAALVNGTAAHALDFDDYEIPGSTHPSAVVAGALLGLAGLRPAMLPALADAYLAGYDAIVQTGRAVGGYDHYLAGWHATSTLGPIGAAAACARLIGLDTDGATRAIALATSSSAGLKRQFGSDAKPLHAGLAARAGLDAALFAEAGLTANPGLGEGPYGFFARYGMGEAVMPHGPNAMEADPALRKPWPSCAYTHRAIEAALVLAATPGFDAARIEAGVIHLPEPFFRVAGFMDPQTPAEARFSVRYCVAAALLWGDLGPRSFEPAAIAGPAVRALMARLAIDPYDAGPGLEDMSPDHPDTVSLTVAGERLTHTVAHVKGGLVQPMSEAEIAIKFTACGGAPLLFARLLDSEGPFGPADAFGERT